MADDWISVQRLHRRIVQKSIVNGDFSHVISKKTVFYREIQSEQLYEMGSNNKIFIEKKTTCYRDANFQNYQLIPFLSQMAYFQISEKAKMKNILSYKDSYTGFLCIMGTSETRNVGRQMTLARDVKISTSDDDVKRVYDFLQLRPASSSSSSYWIVVNSACLPITKTDFFAIDLLELKRTFVTIECYRDAFLLFVNYKPGMLYKRLDSSSNLWVTPRDLKFWWRSQKMTFDFLTAHMTDMIPYWNHNGFPKNVLALNTLRNSILSRTSMYSKYFKETTSAYNVSRGDHHETVMRPADAFSESWVISMPKVPLMFTSFQGMTQDDCIAMVGESDSFDVVKSYTLKIKLANSGNKYFHSASGGVYPGGKLSFLGTLVCRESALDIVLQSTNITLTYLGRHACQIYFSKPGFQLSEATLFRHSFLFLYVESACPCKDGDKLCSLAGQKGVVRRSELGPKAYDEDGREHVPLLLINPESLIKRQTMGQILEMVDSGGGTDCPCVVNSHNKRVKGSALVGRAFYFIVNYKSSDHIYLANQCVRDKITSLPVRGRSRSGGMKLGAQELTNSLIGNGIASCYEEKMILHSDRVITEGGLAVPKSIFVIKEDMKFFKVTHDIEIRPLVTVVSRRRRAQEKP